MDSKKRKRKQKPDNDKRESRPSRETDDNSGPQSSEAVAEHELPAKAPADGLQESLPSQELASEGDTAAGNKKHRSSGPSNAAEAAKMRQALGESPLPYL